ncbi:hypothetical protein FRC00_000967 [Tulasnella sp. 408]|nr:hypothetical protein FRC00_000967 [Tulasnella sp. 408]
MDPLDPAFALIASATSTVIWGFSKAAHPIAQEVKKDVLALEHLAQEEMQAGGRAIGDVVRAFEHWLHDRSQQSQPSPPEAAPPQPSPPEAAPPQPSPPEAAPPQSSPPVAAPRQMVDPSPEPNQYEEWLL